MELKSALFKNVSVYCQAIKCFYMNVTCLCRRGKTFCQPLVSADGIKSKKKNALFFFPFNFYPSLYMVELWVYRSFDIIVHHIQTHHFRSRQSESPKAFTIQPFRQYFTFVAKFRGRSVKRWKSLYVLMSYKYLSCFGSRVFSGCQSLALHVVDRIRGFYFLQGQKKKSTQQPNKKKGKNKLIWHKFQVLGVQLLWFSQASAVECQGAETIDLLCWIQQFQRLTMQHSWPEEDWEVWVLPFLRSIHSVVGFPSACLMSVSLEIQLWWNTEIIETNIQLLMVAFFFLHLRPPKTLKHTNILRSFDFSLSVCSWRGHGHASAHIHLQDPLLFGLPCLLSCGGSWDKI